MGQQQSNNRQKLQQIAGNQYHHESKSLKTNFFYINPLKCQPQQDLQPNEQQFLQIDIIKHEQQYKIIENNQEQLSINQVKDLQKIDEIKVKWNQFIKMKKRNYLQDYSLLKQIGRGGFGCVHKVKGRYTGLYRAAKRIKKAQLKKSDHEKLFEEMAIMISLDHPNIAKLYEVYDYKSYYVLILQLCQGGQLFKKIVTKQLNQQFAGIIMRQILRSLIYLHSCGIVHRDLKPENMLFQQNSDIIKIIDFGIAVKKKPQQILTSRLGTPYYIAPEVLCKCYDEKCDIWSAGVILYMMISGYPPFRGQTQFQVMQNILKQTVTFKGPHWGKVTSDCKNLISIMLKRNPDERPSAKQAFQHPWIKKFIQKANESVIKKQQNILDNIRGFSFQNKLQAVVYTYIVAQLLTSKQKKLFIQIFKQLDKNNDGVISTKQLQEALKTKKDISQQRVNFLMRIIDTNGSGLIDYTEFLVASIDAKKSLTEQHFQQAFQYFDIDHSGAITFEEIAHFLQDTKQSSESIRKIFQQVDENNDGSISKQEFVKLLFQQTKKKIYNSFCTIDQIQKQKGKNNNNLDEANILLKKNQQEQSKKSGILKRSGHFNKNLQKNQQKKDKTKNVNLVKKSRLKSSNKQNHKQIKTDI